MSLVNRSTLNADLTALQNELASMGKLAEAAIQQAMQALLAGDNILAQQVIAADEQINTLRYRIEELCVATLATQQPMAGDLRAVIAAFTYALELERIADHAAGIAAIVLRLENEPTLSLPPDLANMAEMCLEMLRNAMTAYADRNADLARSVAANDENIDDTYKQVFRTLLDLMLEDQRIVTAALYLLFVAHNLERIGDRTVNLAERVIFMTSGTLEELNLPPGHPATTFDRHV